MRIQSGQLVSLGYGKYARSDEVIAVEPITEGRGPGRRTLVWVRGLPDAMVASRSDGSIADDLTTPTDDGTRAKEQRATLRRLVVAIEGVSPALRRVIDEESGSKVDELVEEAHRLL